MCINIALRLSRIRSIIVSFALLHRYTSKCREELGLLQGNKRRPIDEIQGDYPDIGELCYELSQSASTTWRCV